VRLQGHCAEALAFYAKVFEGTNLQMMRYADGPGAPDAWKASRRIMHGQVTIDDGTFMASDYPPGTDGDSQQGFSVMQSAKDVQTAKARFDALADGGTILDDFKPTFFPPASV